MFQSDKTDASKLHSVTMPAMPIPTTGATAVLIGRKVFVAGGLTGDVSRAKLVQVFNVSTGHWKTLPPAPQFTSKVIAIDKKLILIGGRDSTNRKVTNMVSTWMVDEEKWVQTIPPMNMKRARPGVLLLNKLLIVFGGRAEDKTILESIEVLDTERNQWIRNSGRGLLPQPLRYLRIGRYDDTVLLTSAMGTATAITDKSWKIPVRVLEESVSNPLSRPLQWTPIADTPFYRSSLLINSKQPVLVGGERGPATRNIYALRSEQWDLIGELSEQRIRPAVLTISDSAFLVFGGCTDPTNPYQSLLSSVELIMYSL